MSPTPMPAIKAFFIATPPLARVGELKDALPVWRGGQGRRSGVRWAVGRINLFRPGAKAKAFLHRVADGPMAHAFGEVDEFELTVRRGFDLWNAARDPVKSAGVMPLARKVRDFRRWAGAGKRCGAWPCRSDASCQAEPMNLADYGVSGDFAELRRDLAGA